jgi:hypothetical protein
MHLKGQQQKQNGLASQYTFQYNGNGQFDHAPPNAAGTALGVGHDSAAGTQKMSKLSEHAQLAQAFVGSGLNAPDTA